jgi:hypothetical protein
MGPMGLVGLMGPGPMGSVVSRECGKGDACPKWFWCSTVRLGRGIRTSLAEREHYTGKHSAHRGLECPKCCLKILNLEMHYAQRHSKLSEWAVQNGLYCSAVRAGRGSEPLSQSESTTPENILHTGVWNVQNAV